MTIKMLIDATHEEETRIAIVHGTRVEEFDYESSAKKQIKGNIYLAKITRVEPSLQAAFVEYGGNRHGFLAFSEIHPDYYQIPVSDREQLIAEESAAYAALAEDDEDIVEPAPKPKPKRRPRRSTKVKAAQEDVIEEANAEATATETKNPDADTKKDEASENTPEEKTEEIGAESSETADNSETEADKDTGEATPSITKAEGVSDTEVIIEKTPSGENSDDILDDEDDETEITGSHIIDDEEAEEKLRIKIAKGLRRKYKIQEVIKKNQVILIQVVKEERGNKGAALTTYLSLPGRYCVLMPNTLHGGGVSRKIASASERRSLKNILSDLDMPSGIACIIRTAGEGRTKMEIKRDFDYLIRTWEGIRERTLKSVAPVMINEEGDLIKRSLRDLYTREVDEILVAGEDGYKTARNFMRLLMPSHARKIKHYAEQVPLLHKFQVESQLDSMYSPIAQLKSGGYIVINPTEALVSIDVNSGKATKEHNIEETARKTNLEAAEEIARQLRLRDMAGLIVIDFIDMEIRGNNRALEQRMKECLKSDRARIQVGRISSFGLMEMSRQRLRAGVLESSTTQCPHCEGAGVIRSVESQVLHVLRALEDEGIKGRNDKVTLYLPQKTAVYLLNNKRAKLVSLEEQYKFTIEVAIDTSLTESAYKLDMANPDQKKPERHSPAKHERSHSSGPQNHNRDQAEKPRRNRQRNENRRNKDAPQTNAPNVVQDKDSIAMSPENNQETAAATDHQISTTSENQDDKPRHRRRRPRRNNRGPLDVPKNQGDTVSAVEIKTEEMSQPVESPGIPPASEDDKKSDRPRRQRSRRKPTNSNVRTDSKSESPENSTEGDDKHTSDNKSEQKSARRPYPPQARSKRMPSEGRKNPSEPAVKQDATPKTEMGSQVVPQKAIAPKKAAEPKEAIAQPKEQAPKKSGWWQRTFG